MAGLAKAKLVEIKNFSAKSPQADKASPDHEVEVQFNPQSLRLSFANNNKGGDQPGGGSKQFLGSGSSTMSVELLFDTTGQADASNRDVRKKTQLVAYFVMATKKDEKNKNKRVPPRVRFEWGSFIFEGVVESMEETLDFFSEQGVPLRATVSLRLARDDIVFLINDLKQEDGGVPPSGPGAAGTEAREPARSGDSLQQLASRLGRGSDWKAIATANNIDDPLRLRAGALISLNVSTGGRA